MTAGSAARRRSRSRHVPRAPARDDAAQDLAEHAGHRDEGHAAAASRSRWKARGSPTPTRRRRSIACSSSVGRRPNSAVPGLDKTGVQGRRTGFIKVDRALRTDEPNIFAIGDVVGEPMLAHKASHEARVAVEAIAGHKVAFEPQAIPAVVFTDPEVAWCGLTETEAQKQGRKVEIAKFPWAALGRAVAIDRPDGMTKLDHRSGDRAHPRRRHRRRRRRRTDRRRRARRRDGRARDRPEAHHPPAPDAVGDADGGGRGLLRPVDARLPSETEMIAS